MTAIKVSQLPEASVISVNDEIILNDVDQTPVATTKATLATVFSFAETQLTFNTAQIQLVNPQQPPNAYSGIPGRPELGGPVLGRNIVSGVLPPIGQLNTQEDYNIWLVNAVVSLDEEIDRIEDTGVGVVEVKAGTGLVTSPINGIVSSGTISVGADVVLTDVKQTITAQKTYTSAQTFTAAVNAQDTLAVTGASVFADNLTCGKTVTAQTFVGDGSQLTGIETGGSVNAIIPGDGLLQGVNSGVNNDTPITDQGTISVNNTVLRTTGDQNIGGVKTFTGTPEFDNGLKTSGNITPETTITVGAASTIYLGDGSNLTGIPETGIQSLVPADGLMTGPNSGTGNDTPITTTGSISVDDTVVRTNASSTQTLASNLTVDGNITSTNGIFTGDGSGLTNLDIVAGPFSFNGTVDAVNGSPPTDPVPTDADIYFNTVAGQINGNWSPIPAGTAIGVDQMLIYSGQIGGWAMGTAIDRGTFVAVDGDTMTGTLNIDQGLNVTGTTNLTGLLTAAGGVVGDLTGDVTGNVTGNVTGDLTGNADSANLATIATNATNVTVDVGTGTDDFYLTFAGNTTGNQGIKTDQKLTYNVYTHTLGIQNVASLVVNASTAINCVGNITTTTGKFVGPLEGNADTATTATTASTATSANQANKVRVSTSTTDATFNVPFVTNDGDYEDVHKNVNFNFNPFTDTLSVLAVTSSDITTSALTVSGSITSGVIANSGAITTKDLSVIGGTFTSATNTLGDLTTSGTVTMVSATVSTTFTSDAIVASTADITTVDTTKLVSSGNIEVIGDGRFVGDGSGLRNLPIQETGGTVTQIDTGTGLTGGPITESGTISIDNSVITTSGGQSIGNTTTLNQLAVQGGGITSEANIQALAGAKFVGDGSGLVNLPAGTGTVTEIKAATDGGITTSPADGIVTTGTISVDNTVVRTAGSQTVAGVKTFSDPAFFQDNVDCSGTVTAAFFDGDGSALTNLTLPDSVSSVTSGTGIITSPADGITSTGSVSIDPDVVATLSGTQRFQGVNTFEQKIVGENGADIVGNSTVTGDFEATQTITANEFVGDGSKLTGIKAGMFTFKGDTSVLGDAPAAESGDVFQNTTAGLATDSWTGIAGLPVGQNQLVIYGLGGEGVNVWFRGAIADTGQFLSTTGGTVDGNVAINGELAVSNGITGDLTGTASEATDCSRSINGGNGLSGGGKLNSDRTLTVLPADETITVTSSGIAVDGTKVTAANATNAVLAASATEVKVNQTNDDLVVFIAGGTGTGSQPLQSTTGVSFNPNTNEITATSYVGDGTKLTGVVNDTTDQQIEGIKTFTSFPRVPDGDPGLRVEVASKGYVDDQVIASGSGTVVSVAPGTGLTSSTGGAITTSGTLSVDADEVVLIDTTQSITGSKTFTIDTNFSQDVGVTGTVTAAFFAGDGSQLTNLPVTGGTVTSVTSGSGIVTSPTEGITATGSISVDSTVLRTQGAQTIEDGGSLSVGGNISATNGGIFSGDGSGLTNLPMALGPFNFKGEVDVTTDTVPETLSNGDVYVNTVAGTATNDWSGIEGRPVGIDQLVVYTTETTPPGWLLGSALDRGQFVPTSGGTFTGNVAVTGTLNATDATTLADTLSVTGTSTLTGLVTSPGGFTCSASGVFTGDLVGTASEATHATTADTADNANNATAATTAAVADTVSIALASDDTDYLLTFAQQGDKPIKVNGNLAFNPTDNIVECQAVISSNKNITTTGDVAANALSGDGSLVTNVDALSCQKAVTAGNGLTGGGTLSSDVSLAVGSGLGIDVSADSIAVKLAPSGGLSVDADGLSVDVTDLPATAAIGTDPPSNAVAGDLWWDSDEGLLFIYYADANSAQWVSATPTTATFAAQISALQAQVNTLLTRVSALEN